MLLTGSTGIAAATAKLAARQGAQVFVVSRTEAHCRALADEIASTGGTCAWHAADLTAASAAAESVRRCVERFGRIDALFNVAGVSGRGLGDGPIHECSEEGWDYTITTNVRSMFLMCREAVKQMLAQPVDGHGLRGSILNMASVLGFSPEPKFFGTHAYAASKGAILGMSKAMAAYYAPHKIRVNVIAPSLIRTPMSQRAQEKPEVMEFMKSKQPLAEDFIEPEEIAKAALFLLGTEASMITGDVLTVDAGWCVSG